MAEIMEKGPIKVLAQTQAPAVGGGITGTGLTGSRFIQIRRRNLYLLADAWGVVYAKDCPATTMRILLEQAGVDPNIEPPRPIAAKPVNDIASPEKPILDMGFQELRAACKERGISYNRSDKTDDLKAKLGHGHAS